MKTIKVLTLNNVSVLDLETVKKHCKISVSDDDNVIKDLILSAKLIAEKLMNLHFLETELLLTADNFEYANSKDFASFSIPFLYNVPNLNSGVRYIQLLRTPILEVIEVSYIDSDDVENIIDAADYFLDNTGRLVFSNSLDFGSMRAVAGLQVTYKVGFGKQASDIPGDLRVALKNHIFYMYNAISIRTDKRANVDPFQLTEGLKSIYMSYRNNNGI